MHQFLWRFIGFFVEPDFIFFFGVEARHLDLQGGKHSPENSNSLDFLNVSCLRFGVRVVVSIVV